jgi:hypothetical protein
MTLDELERLEQEATPGPWEAFTFYGTPPQRITVKLEDSEGSVEYAELGNFQSKTNTLLAAAARNALPALLRVARAAQAYADATADAAPRDEYYEGIFGAMSSTRAELLAALAVFD